MKKLLLTLGTAGATLAPLATVIACGSSSDGTLEIPSNVQRDPVSGGTAVTEANLNSYLALDGHDHSADDKSFNESAWNGIHAADPAADKDARVIKPSATNEESFISMYNRIPKDSVIVAPGWVHTSTLGNAGTALDTKNVIHLDGDVPHKDIASVMFDAEQAAFLAGITTAEWLNHSNNKATYEGGGLKVGTYGGLNMPTVTSFMGGFQAGINYFNEEIAVDNDDMDTVDFVDLGNLSDYFSGGFAAGHGTAISEKLLAQGADVILPVAGPQTADTIAAIKSADSDTKVIGVDSVQEVLFDETATNDTVLFSILKRLDNATEEILSDIGKYIGKLTIGDLENGWVGLSDGELSDGSFTSPDIEAIVDSVSANGTYEAKALDFDLEFNY